MTEGFTAEQIDFEESRREHDRSAARAAGIARERARYEHSVAKSYALRGFKGKGFPELHGAERMERMKTVARKERIAAGTEGVSHQLRRFSQVEGLLPHGNRPNIPWVSRTGKHHKVVAVVKPFDLRSAIARFKRTGALPSVPVEIVQGASVENIDGRALKRMIKLMLVKSGIEENPGPHYDTFGEPLCRYSGLRVQGERVRIHGKHLLICQGCSSQLTECHGSMGLHPGGVAETTPSSKVTQPSPSVPSTPVSTPILQEVKTQIADNKPAVVESKPPAIEHPLSGHTISDADRVAIMSRLVGKEIELDQIVVEQITVPYIGERRLATSRNVQEIKQAFQACQLSVNTAPERTWHHYAIVACAILTLIEIGLSFLYNAPLFSIVGAVVFSVSLTLYLTVRPRYTARTYSLPYIPHLVSSVMAEYDRGTNVVAARSTLRQKIRRLASLPIPDVDALKFIAGSELVCEQLLTNEDFFWEGAACFRQPR